MEKVILVISDQHIPHHHQDMIPFLTAIKKKYKPDRIVHIGDECDKHGLKYFPFNGINEWNGPAIKVAYTEYENVVKHFDIKNLNTYH